MSKKKIACTLCGEFVKVENIKIRPWRGILSWVCSKCWID